MTVVRYDPANGPSGGPTPGALALRDHWRKVTGLPDLGIYNPRRIRGAKGWSIHAEGRAVDGAANAHDPAHKAKADRYCQFLIDNAYPLQVQYLIWDRRSWKSGRGWAKYSGTSPHTDHVHMELNRDGARTVTARQLDALWSEWTGDHDKPDQEDDDMLAEIREFHEVYLGASSDAAAWKPEMVRSFDYHLERALGGRSLQDIRKEFAATAKGKRL